MVRAVGLYADGLYDRHTQTLGDAFAVALVGR